VATNAWAFAAMVLIINGRPEEISTTTGLQSSKIASASAFWRR